MCLRDCLCLDERESDWKQENSLERSGSLIIPLFKLTMCWAKNLYESSRDEEVEASSIAPNGRFVFRPGSTVHAILAVDARLTTEEERLVTLSCKRIFELFYHTQQVVVYPMLHALFPLFLLLRETKESEPFFLPPRKKESEIDELETRHPFHMCTQAHSRVQRFRDQRFWISGSSQYACTCVLKQFFGGACLHGYVLTSFFLLWCSFNGAQNTASSAAGS